MADLSNTHNAQSPTNQNTCSLLQSKQVRIKESDNILHIYDLHEDKLVAKWDLSKHKEIINVNNNHYRLFDENLDQIRERLHKKLNSVGIKDTKVIMDKLSKTCPTSLRDQYRGMEKIIDRYSVDLWSENSSAIMSLPEISGMRVERVLKESLKTKVVNQAKENIITRAFETQKDMFQSINQYDVIINNEVIL